MRSDLCRAIAHCQARRLGGIAASAPVVALAGAAVVFLAPFLAFRLGETVGTEVGATGLQAELATAVVVGPALGAAAAGAVIGASLPAREALGHQLVASPVGNLAAVAAGLFVPGLLALVLVLPALVAACLGLGGGLPGGRVSGIGLVIGIVAAACAGAFVGEATLAIQRGQRRAWLALGSGVGVWGGVGVALGATALGPLTPIVSGLAGGSPWIASAVAGSAAVVCLAAWLALASRRPLLSDAAPSRRGRGQHLLAPVPGAVAAAVGRRGDVRLSVAAAVAFGLGGALIGRSAGSGTSGPFLLATSTALLCSVVGSLASCGALLQGRWLWCGAPLSRGAVAALALAAGLVAVAMPVALVGCVATLVSGSPRGAWAVVLALTVGVAAAATIAGALAPWSRDSVGSQFGSLAAFVAVGIVASLVAELTGPRIVSLGMPGPLVAGVLCCILAAGAVATVRSRLEAGLP